MDAEARKAWCEKVRKTLVSIDQITLSWAFRTGEWNPRETTGRYKMENWDGSTDWVSLIVHPEMPRRIAFVQYDDGTSQSMGYQDFLDCLVDTWHDTSGFRRHRYRRWLAGGGKSF